MSNNSNNINNNYIYINFISEFALNFPCYGVDEDLRFFCLNNLAYVVC